MLCSLFLMILNNGYCKLWGTHPPWWHGSQKKKKKKKKIKTENGKFFWKIIV